MICFINHLFSKRSQVLAFSLLLFCFFGKNIAQAQNQLEFSVGSYPSPPNGATTANQSATTLESLGSNVFQSYSPSVIVTATLSNQQYASIPTTVVSTGTGMIYGASSNSLGTSIVSIPVFNSMNSIASPSNSSFTSSSSVTTGTGIDVSGNYGFSFYNSVYPLFANNASTNGRFYYGDLTLTFSRPVSNPVLQISGLGGNVNFGGTNIQGFSTELELQGSSLTATKLSGTSELSVSSNKILNSASTLSFGCGSGAACGSVRIAGTNITTLTFKIFVRGDGKGTAWSSNTINAGDVFVMGVSLNKPVSITGNVYSDPNGLTDNLVYGTGTNAGGTLFANLVDANSKVVASSAVSALGAYTFSAVGEGNYTIVLSTTNGTQGSNAPNASLPSGWVNTGENLGANLGNDGNIDGTLSVTVGSADLVNANFGIYGCPAITNISSAQSVCVGSNGSNIVVTTSQTTSSGIKLVRFTSNQIAGSSPTATELANIYAGTAIATLSPSAGTASYTWSSADFPNTTNSPITYFVYAILNPDAGTTCRPYQVTTVTVNPLPTVAAITGTNNVCVGNTINLTSATSGGVWSSSNTAVATISSTGVVTGVSAGSTTISYAVTNANGCVTTVTYAVTVNALPVVAAITGANNVCVGNTISLSNATTGGVWSSSNTAVATITSSGIVTGVTNGATTIRYTVTNANGCVTTVTYVVTVNALPVVAAITGTNNVCVGNTINLTSATSGGVWSSSNMAAATISSTGVVTGISAGTTTISYTVTNANGCITTVTYVVTVNALPVVAAITGTNNVCIGNTVTLNNTTTGGVWSSSNTTVATISTTGVVTGVSAGTTTISYTVTNANGCVTTVTYVVTVNALPVVAAITGASNVCVGNTISLSNATTGGVWSSSNTTVATISTTGVVTGVSAGTTTISYTVTNANGCVTTVTYVVTVNALPVVAAITGANNVCVGNTVTLSNATVGGVWSSSNTAVATINSTGVVNGLASGTTLISYTVTNANGCVTTVTYVFTVNALPVVSAITGLNSLCVGNTISLSNATSGGVWSSSNTAVATISTTGVVSGVSAGTSTISYTVTNANGCVTTVTYSITVNALPTVAAITGTNNVCVGNTVTLSNATTGGVWSSSNTAVATISSIGVVTGVSAGTSTISYTVTNGNGCVTTVTYTITVNALPTVSAITGANNVCVGNTTTLSSATTGGVWSSSNTAVATISASGVVTGVSAGTSTISYTVTNTNGCITTVTYVITVNSLPVVAPITGNNLLAVTDIVTLTSITSGGVWSSSNTAIATVSATGVVTGISVGTVTISYTVTNGNGCTTVVTYTLTINPKANG